MKKAFIFGVLMFICFISYSSIDNTDKIQSFMLEKTKGFIDSVKEQGKVRNKLDYIWIINIVKLDLEKGKCHFSISYILNQSDINDLKPSGYFRINQEIILVLTKKKYEKYLEKIQISKYNQSIENECLEILNDFWNMWLYHPVYQIFEMNKNNIRESFYNTIENKQLPRKYWNR